MKDLNEKQIAILQQLSEGGTLAQIAKQLGVTRDAVSGSVFRMVRAGVPGAAPPGARRKAASTARPAPTPAAPPARVVPGAPVDLIDLQRTHCRFPVAEDPWRFCGCRAEAPPYCAAHRKMCYTARQMPA